jgi:hypothetical protein
MLRLFFSLFAPLRLCGKHSYKNKNLRTCYAEYGEVSQRLESQSEPVLTRSSQPMKSGYLVIPKSCPTRCGGYQLTIKSLQCCF